MKITLLTIFPEIFPDAFDDGMIRVAREKGQLELSVVNLRDFTDDPHRSTDDYPFALAYLAGLDAPHIAAEIIRFMAVVTRHQLHRKTQRLVVGFVVHA